MKELATTIPAPRPHSNLIYDTNEGHAFVKLESTSALVIRSLTILSLPRPQESLLIISWCARRCGIGALQSMNFASFWPRRPALPICPRYLFARATPAPGDEAALIDSFCAQG